MVQLRRNYVLAGGARAWQADMRSERTIDQPVENAVTQVLDDLVCVLDASLARIEAQQVGQDVALEETNVQVAYDVEAGSPGQRAGFVLPQHRKRIDRAPRRVEHAMPRVERRYGARTVEAHQGLLRLLS